MLINGGYHKRKEKKYEIMQIKKIVIFFMKLWYIGVEIVLKIK